MPSFLSKLAGKSQIKVKGLNQNRHLKNLCDKGVVCYNIKKQSIQEMQFFVNSKNVKVVEEEFKNSQQLEKTPLSGALFVLSFFKKYMVIFLAFALCFLSFPFFNLFVWQIKVFSTSSAFEQTINDYLTENKIGVGRLKKDYDLQKIENSLIEKFNEIALIDVCFKGESLIVSVREKNYSLNENFKLSPIISNYDGMVLEVLVKSGTAKVKVGDYVKTGSILVEPYIIRGEKFLPCEVDAKIVVRSFCNREELFFENVEVNVRTGKKTVKNDFTFLGKNGKIKLDKIRFKHFEIEQICNNKPVFPILPLKLTSVVVFEVEKKIIYQNFEENRLSFEEGFKQKVLQELCADEIVLEKISSTKQDEGVFKTSFYAEFIKTY